ncbi:MULTISPECIES: hypothetical protein [Arsenophonus]|uniref:hypothetical protein n=1 Tax=Arsenophonus TaxID=637 RepID=UPI0015D6A1F6|nr:MULTISPECIES: hypothetical protein [Arsenophonus]UBX30273.1 hypothetical protein LDL57_06680 [Arsenophonus apicola]
MATKLVIIIQHDNSSNQCRIEWSTAATKDVTSKEQQMLTQMQKALLVQFDYPVNPAALH